MREDHEVRTETVVADETLTAPLKVADEEPAGPEPAAPAPEGAAPAPEGAAAASVTAFGRDVDRFAGLVAQLAQAAAALDDRLDGEVRDVVRSAEQALAEARAARREAAEADARAARAEARAEAAAQEAAEAQEELQKGLAAAKASVTAAQESEANAWREAGAAQQARATAANEAAHAEGVRKRAEAAWSTEHQARTEAERERDDLAARLAAEQTALAGVRTDLEAARTELADARTKLDAAADTERRLRAELSVVQGEVAGLTVERDGAVARAAEQTARAERAERLADAADARILDAVARADRAEQRADAAETRIDRDAATVRALQDTLRAALDLPSVAEIGDVRGVPVDESGAVVLRPDGLIGVQGVPDALDGELAGRFARAILAVRVHQATYRAAREEPADPAAAAPPAEGTP